MSLNDSSNESELSPDRDRDALANVTAGTATTVIDEGLEAEFAEKDVLISDEFDELKPKGKALKKKTEAKKNSSAAQKKKNRNPITIILTFLRQVISQMKKVHWITRKQTVAYTIAVLIFVIICVAFVAGWDVFFGYLMNLIFVRNHSIG